MRIILIFGMLSMLISCGNAKREMLCRTWQVSDVQFINEKESTVITDTMKGNEIEVAKFQLRDILMKNIYQFKEDGSYITGINPLIRKEIGKWRRTPFALFQEPEKSKKRK